MTWLTTTQIRQNEANDSVFRIEGKTEWAEHKSGTVKTTRTHKEQQRIFLLMIIRQKVNENEQGIEVYPSDKESPSKARPGRASCMLGEPRREAVLNMSACNSVAQMSTHAGSPVGWS